MVISSVMSNKRSNEHDGDDDDDDVYIEIKAEKPICRVADYKDCTSQFTQCMHHVYSSPVSAKVRMTQKTSHTHKITCVTEKLTYLQNPTFLNKTVTSV